jgi:PAS domain S-box-containing protein
MANLQHELFLLMLHLSRMRDRDLTIRVFVDALAAATPGTAVRLLAEGEESRGEIVDIATASERFGRIAIEEADALAPDERALYRSAIAMLAVVLENASRERRLATENARLDAAVAARTASLQRALAESDDLYQNAPCGYHSLGPDGTYLRVNDTELRWLGRTREEIVGKQCFSDLLTTESRGAFQRLFDVLKDRGSAENAELVLLRKDGSELPVLLSATAVRTPDGCFVMSRGTVYDNSERRQAERQLRESEERYREVFDHVSDSIFVLDVTAEGRFRFLAVNPAAARVSGISVGDTPGPWLEDVVRPEVVAHVLPYWRQSVASREPLEYVDDYVRKTDGARFVLLTTVVPVCDEGAVRRLLVVSRDVTEVTRAQAEVRALNQDLEHRVAERTLELQEANAELESFAYTVSHDLRAPIRHIGGFAGLLRRRIGATLDEKSAHYLANIDGATTRMGELIDDLLSFSRMGRRELLRCDVNLTDLIQERIRELEPEAQGRAVHWRVDELPTVCGDPAMLRIAFTNLLSNALKFTLPRAEASIEISRVPGEESEHVILVRDNGVGFDMAHAGKLFGVFQRLHRTDEFDGTGIGLATVRRIVTRHGGRTWAEGQPGVGATFFIAIPRVPSPAR